MASVFKRPADKARGKMGKWTCSYKGADGKFKTAVGTTDKAETQKLANHLESQAKLEREGLVDPGVAARRRHATTPLGDHLAAFGDHLRAKGDSEPYCKRVPPAVRRVLDSAGIATIAQITAPAIQGAIGRAKAGGASARTCNYNLTVTKTFVSWLVESGRLASAPRGMESLAGYNVEADRKRIRRAISRADLAKLLAVVEGSVPRKISRSGYQFDERWMSGPERAALYRLAMGTGFRVDELRSLRRESFRLEGAEPSVILEARDAKNGKRCDQPITAELASHLRPFVDAAVPGSPVLPVPMDMAGFIRSDLARAGIPYETADGVLDFHALRHSYITHLIQDGVNPKVVQRLARHSTITLTLDRYTHVEQSDLRSALNGGKQ